MVRLTGLNHNRSANTSKKQKILPARCNRYAVGHNGGAGGHLRTTKYALPHTPPLPTKTTKYALPYPTLTDDILRYSVLSGKKKRT